MGKNLLFGTLILSSIFAIISCNTVETNGFVIKGTIDIEEDKSIYLIEADPNGQPVTVDSTKISNGTFKIKGDLDKININFLFVEGLNGNIPVVLENGTIEAQIFKDSINSSIVFGTTSNNDLFEYRKNTQRFVNSMNALVQEINQANISGNGALSQSLTSEYKAVEVELGAYERSFINSNPNSYVASLILERLLTVKSISTSEAKQIFDKFDIEIQQSISGEKITAFLNQPVNPTDIGQVAPGFEGPTPTGSLISLESFRGKVTIIDFWASWCRPCRIENPNLVRLYNRMHDHGLEIISVSLDKHKSSWEKAIEDDGLNWHNVSNLKFWQDPIALLYGVRSIPAAFVLDKNGVIVGKNLRGAQLDAKIEELLTQ